MKKKPVNKAKRLVNQVCFRHQVVPAKKGRGSYRRSSKKEVLHG